MVIALIALLLPSLVLRFCPLEYQLVPVADIQVIGDLKGPVIGVVVDVKQANHRGPRSQPKYPGFLGCWHACANHLNDAHEPVAQVLDGCVRAFR
jgi:hypothetical protein